MNNFNYIRINSEYEYKNLLLKKKDDLMKLDNLSENEVSNPIMIQNEICLLILFNERVIKEADRELIHNINLSKYMFSFIFIYEQIFYLKAKKHLIILK